MGQSMTQTSGGLHAQVTAGDALGLWERLGPPAPRHPRDLEHECREAGLDTVTATVTGPGAMAAALADALPFAASAHDVSVLNVPNIPIADVWIAVVDMGNTAGERCWLRAAEVALTAARLAEMRQLADSHVPRVVLALVGGPSPDLHGHRASVSPHDLEELRVLARQAFAPWLCEAVGRRLVGDCEASLGGSVVCRAVEHLTRAVTVASALLPEAAWVTVPEVLIPFAEGPWISWARRLGNGPPPSTSAGTIASVATTIVERLAADAPRGKAWRSACVPARLAGQAAIVCVEAEHGLDDPR